MKLYRIKDLRTGLYRVRSNGHFYWSKVGSFYRVKPTLKRIMRCAPNFDIEDIMIEEFEVTLNTEFRLVE